MKPEVFIIGADQGAVSYPNTDARYFEMTFYNVQEKGESGKPILDVRLRHIGDKTYVDYTIVLYGLKTTTGRPNGHIGLTYRLKGCIKDLRRVYDFLMSELRGLCYNNLLTTDMSGFLKQMSDFKGFPEEMARRFDQIFDESDITPIPQSVTSTGEKQLLNPEDIYRSSVGENVSKCKVIRVSELYPSVSQKEMNAKLQQREEQMKATLTEQTQKSQSRIDALSQKISQLQKQSREDRERIEDYEDRFQKAKERLDIPAHSAKDQSAGQTQQPEVPMKSEGEKGGRTERSGRFCWWREALSLLQLILSIVILGLLVFAITQRDETAKPPVDTPIQSVEQSFWSRVCDLFGDEDKDSPKEERRPQEEVENLSEDTTQLQNSHSIKVEETVSGTPRNAK